MEVVALIGRLLFAAMFINSGIGHLREREGMIAHARSQGAPAPELGVPGSGLLILVGGVLVALGLWPDLGALLIAAFLIPVTFFMHPFWKMSDPQMRQMQQIQFGKNLSLTGASLLAFALFAECGDQIGLMAGGPLF
jgi:putative oxidoreductase